ncbi:transposase [Streptomyces sp. NPDC057636]|uniref:transposase n=1 Tax=Streptomyces sp. NPDC057636 TaxID=3346189 RepID=UPI0036C0CF45
MAADQRGRDRVAEDQRDPGHPVSLPRQQDPHPLGPCNHLTAETVESPLPSNRHGGFGERSGETDREQSRHRAPGLLSDEAGFSMTPPRARTWGRRGHTPIIRVRGRSRRRTSVAALCCYKPGQHSRLIHRPRNHLLLKGARKSFSWTDYRDLLVRAHIQLGGPIVVVWDNLNTHLAAGLKRYEAEHEWLTTIRLPPYAPDLNPVEAIWSLVRRATANTAFNAPDDLDRTLRRELRRIQLRPRLIDGCLTTTGLTIAPPTSP